MDSKEIQTLQQFNSDIWLPLYTTPCHFQQLIPYVDEDGSKNDDRAGPPRFASEERREIAEVNKVYFSSVYFIFRSS